MSKAVCGVLVAAALALALVFRLAGPDLRPMHHDEANQAVKFATLLETGEYRYDPNDHHGPTLYYFTLPSAWIRGQKTLASLDERTLRAVPALFSAGLILLIFTLRQDLGRTEVAASALLTALSPALTYYGRFYIQESLFAFFALAFLIALGRSAERPRVGWALGAGALAGLAYSTKETSLIVLVASVTSVALARVWVRSPRGASTPAWHALRLALGLTAAALVALVLYSSFLRHPLGLVESVRAFAAYVERGIDPGPHREPWYYYLALLSYSASGGLVWTEALVLVLAAVGVIVAVSKRDSAFWPRYICLYSLITALAFAIVRYKTPWNLLPFYVGFVLLAGSGAAALIDRARPRAVRTLLVVALLAAGCHLGVENWRANFRYPADPRNPYVYAQTSPDLLRLVERVTDVAALDPDRAGMLVKVIAGPYEQWPLPWYLRRMTRVGYWIDAAGAGRLDEAPVLVASQENAAKVDAALGDRYVSEFYGLRPGVLLTLYVERGLWERFLGSRGASIH
jgi:uncharacterized protein (TIGR03663 family)